jgi:hypothetical protein
MIVEKIFIVAREVEINLKNNLINVNETGESPFEMGANYDKMLMKMVEISFFLLARP